MQATEPSMRRSEPLGKPQRTAVPGIPKSRGALTALLLVTLLAGAIRFTALDAESLWMDECAQTGTYVLPFKAVVLHAVEHGQPPLDYLIGAVLDRLGLATSDWWVRVPAALFGTGTVFLLGWWIVRFAGAVSGVLAAALLTVCPLHVAMSQEARPYAIFVFFTLAAVILFARARHRHTFASWSLFAAALTALLMTRWVGPNLISLGIAAAAAARWIGAKRSGKRTKMQAESGRLMATFAGTAFAYAVYGPLFGIILYRMSRTIGSKETLWITRFADHLHDTYTAVLTGYSPATLSASGGASWFLLAAGALALAGLVVIIRKAWRRDDEALAFAVALIPFPLLYAALYAAMSVAAPKPQYLLLMAIPLLTGIAVTLDAARRMLSAVSTRAASVAFVALVAVCTVPMTRATLHALTIQEKRDWRGVMTYLQEHAGEHDAFATVGSDRVPTLMPPWVNGVGRYFGPSRKFLRITLETPIDQFENAPWSARGTSVWIVCYKDRFYTGRNSLPPPSSVPPGVRVHDFTGLFLVEVPGDSQASDRLMEGLASLSRDLPDGRAVVAPQVVMGRYLLDRGQPALATTCFESARRQCRDEAERRALDSLLPEPTRLAERGVEHR